MRGAEAEAIPYRVHVHRFDAVCTAMERRSTAVIVVGALGALFSVFWVIFGVIVWGMGVASAGGALLLVAAGGLLPLMGSAGVVWAGIRGRILASRLRDLEVLARGRGALTPIDVAAALALSVRQADDLLSNVLRRGLASVLQGSTGSRAADRVLASHHRDS